MERPPPRTPLKLRYLVKALVKVPEWYELGVELGVAKYVLDEINLDKGGLTERCKDEMLNKWLNNGSDHSWDEVYTAAEEVSQRSEETARRNRQEKEEEETLEAISQVEKAMKAINGTVDKCAKEKRELAEKLEEKNKLWEDFKRKWRDEDEEWTEQEERRQQIKEAIAAGNFQASRFVRSYLTEKSLPEDISVEAVESCLREDVLHQEMERARQLLNRQNDMKNHQGDLVHLQEDSKKWIKQLEDHSKRLETDIISKLQEMGLKPEKLDELQEHLKELRERIIECKSEAKEYFRALQETEDHLKELLPKMYEHFKSFDASVQKLEDSSRGLNVRTVELAESISVLNKAIAVLIGGAMGGVMGVTIGFVIGGIVGGPVGATIGASLAGGLAGGGVAVAEGAIDRANREKEELIRQRRRQLETLNAEQKANEEIAHNCQDTKKTVKELLQTFSKIR